MNSMKLLPVALGLVLATTASAQSIRTSLNIQDVFNTPAWERAFAGDFGVDSGVEPGIPEDPRGLEVIGEIRPLLQANSETSIQGALNILNSYFGERMTAGQTIPAFHAQIAGMLNYQLSRTTANPGLRARAQQEAIGHFEEAIQQFPNFLRAHKNLGDLYFRQDNATKALEHFLQAIQLGDKDPTPMGLVGYIYYEQGNLVSAENALKNALMVDPTVREFRQVLGQVLFNQERHTEAAALFGELLAEDSSNADYWNLQANAFIAQDKIDDAANNLEITRMMGVANPQSLLLLGDVYMNKEMTEDATLAYLDALEQGDDSNFAGSIIQAAGTLNNFRSYDNALMLLNGVDAKFGEELSDEEAIRALTLRSEINLNMGNRDEAAAALEDIIARDPYNGRALISLGRYYAETQPSDDLDEAAAAREISEAQQQAIIYYERVQQLEDPRMAAQGFVMEARLRVQRDELGQAVDLLEEGLQIYALPNVQPYLDQVRAAANARRGA